MFNSKLKFVALLAAALCGTLFPTWLTNNSAAGTADDPAPKPTGVMPLLDQLDQLRPMAGEDAWASVLRDLIQLGPKALPELIAATDGTEDEFKLRCLGFVLRGIGDKRAVPALIRALPRTCARPGSDMGYIAKDPDLLAFMQKHDGQKRHGTTHYHFGRAVNEVRKALQTLTGAKHGEEEIVHVFLQGTPRQQFLQRSLYQRCAERWAAWWELHWNEHVNDVGFARVGLAPLADKVLADRAFPHGPQVEIAGRHEGHILESVRDQKAKRVFIDLDTGREGALPEHLRVAPGQPERLDDILAWAAREGFDLMGTEYVPLGGGKPHYVLRGLGLASWEIESRRWKTLEQEVRADKPLDTGVRTDGLLTHFDAAGGRYTPADTAAFLFQTREGGYGAIFVGVEVHDNSMRNGEIPSLDEALNPRGFYKGRRFSYTLISEPPSMAPARKSPAQ